MSSQKPTTTRSDAAENRDRKTKLAEAGVVFVLVLSLCVFLGIRLAQQPVTEPTVAMMEQPDLPPADFVLPSVSVPGPEPVITPDGMEPAGVVQPEISAGTGQVPDIREILPEVPVYVTYTSAEQTFFEGRYGEAAEMFAVYCERHPVNTWGHYMHGLSLWKAGRNEDARHAFNNALSLQPDHLKSLVNLARVELDLSSPEAALATIERALDVAPRHVEALRVLGRVYHQLDRPDQAAATYLQALQLKADDPWTLNNLALIHIEQEEFARALAPLARAAELAPTVAVIRNNLGTVLERTGHLAQAREQFLLAADLGSARGEDSLSRLAAMTIPASEATADLAAIAAAWNVTDHPGDRQATGQDAVAALTSESGADR